MRIKVVIGLLLIISVYLIYISKTPAPFVTSNNTPIPTTTPFFTPTPTSITIPDSFLIKTAFIPQAPEKIWTQPWQDACEEASLLTLKHYYQTTQPDSLTIKNEILGLIDYESTQGWSHDINIDQMAQLAQNYLHLKATIIEKPSLMQLKTYLSNGIPVIVPASGKILYRENKNFSHNGPYYHNIVILGFNDTKQLFTVHDVGTQYGSYFNYSYQLLLDSIHDLPPSKKVVDINQGQKRVLVLQKLL